MFPTGPLKKKGRKKTRKISKGLSFDPLEFKEVYGRLCMRKAKAEDRTEEKPGVEQEVCRRIIKEWKNSQKG